MGCLSSTHERPANRSGQKGRDPPGQIGGDMATHDGAVLTEGGRDGGQGRLWHDATCGRPGGGNRGRHPCDARPLG